MRIVALAAVLIALLAAAGCGGEEVSTCDYLGQRYVVGDRFPAGDGCNQCECTPTGVACTEIACFDGGVDVDADPASCQASDGCAEGPACGGVCCDRGERCDDGTATAYLTLRGGPANLFCPSSYRAPAESGDDTTLRVPTSGVLASVRLCPLTHNWRISGFATGAVQTRSRPNRISCHPVTRVPELRVARPSPSRIRRDSAVPESSAVRRRG